MTAWWCGSSSFVSVRRYSSGKLLQAEPRTPRGKLAEMVAYIRLAEPCDSVVQVPPDYVMEALTLLMVVDPPISEEMIEAKEEAVKNYRAKLGLAKMVPALCRRDE